MSYQPNIPASTDLLSQSQADIQNNFIAIGTLLSPNGNAAITEFATTSATNMAIYTKTSALTARPEMFILRNSTIANPNANPPNPIEFTSATYNATGWTRLPSGILLKWGTSGSGSPNTEIVVTFPSGGTVPDFTAIFSVQISMVGSSGDTGNMFLTSFNITTIRAWYSSGTSNSRTYTYFAIGI